MGDEQVQARFEFAQTLIEEAKTLALHYFSQVGSLTITKKGRQDMASEADLEVERLIRERLSQRFPNDGFLGEETGPAEVGDGEGVWVVDPIDGTQPFVNAMGSWCISIAFVLGGVTRLGCVAAPALGEVYAGRPGLGATLNGREITVSTATRLDAGITYTGYSPRIGADDILPVFDRLLRQGGMFYRDGSGTLDLCYVACGRLVGGVERHMNSWDALAALAIIEGAGGQTNDFLANDGLWVGNRVVAGPPALFSALEAVLEGTSYRSG